MRGTVVGVAIGLALGVVGTAFAADPTAGFPAGWTHLQINVVGPGGKPHTQIFDRGRAQSVTSSSVTLRESDGIIVTIKVAPNAIVIVNGRRGSFSQIAPGFWVRTLGVDGRPAKRISATAPPRPRVVPNRRVVPPATTTTASAPAGSTTTR